MRHSFGARLATGSAVAALVAVFAAGAPPADAKPIRPQSNPANQSRPWQLPLRLTTESCTSVRKLKLAGGNYRWTLIVWVKGKKRQVTAKTVVLKRGRYEWKDCVKKASVTPSGYMHTSVLRPVGGAKADVAMHPIPAFHGKVAAGKHWTRSRLDNLPEKPAPPAGGDEPPPGAGDSPEPDPDTSGDRFLCSSEGIVRQIPVPNKRVKTQVCPDWAPSGQSIKVYVNADATSGEVGVIAPAGADWYVCGHIGIGRGPTHALTSRGRTYRNHWWAYTMADNGKMGWVPQTYFQGGADNMKDPGLRDCTVADMNAK